MKRPRRTWTDEDKAEIRRLARCTFTYAEIGERYGCSGASIACVVKRHKLLTTAETSAIKSDRLKGRKLSRSEVRAIAKRMKAKWKDPVYWERIVSANRNFRRSEAGKAATAKASQQAVLARRGFVLHPAKSQEYEFLTKTKRLPAKEAAAALGIQVPA